MTGQSNLAVVPPSLEAFVARHPWSGELLGDAVPLEMLWQFDVAATPAELWAYVSDTSRMNRAMGVSRMFFEERNGALHGRSVNAGFVQEWVEVPWVWVAEREISSTRLYSRGFARAVRAIFELSALGTERTRLLVYFGWIPRGFWQRWVLNLAMTDLERQYRRVLREVEGHIAQSRPVGAALAAPKSTLAPEQESRLSELAERLEREGVARAVCQRLAEYVRSADELELYRIQVRPLARRLEIPESDLLGALLLSTRVGLFELSWDVICPHCRGVRAEQKTLGAVAQRGDCGACGIDFATDSENAIEVTFHVHPSVRRVERVFHCSAEPAFKQHIQLQLVLEPGEQRTVATSLVPGSYRLRHQRGQGDLDVRAEAEPQTLAWTARATPDERASGPSPTFEISNDSGRSLTFVVERTTWSDDALRPSALFSLQRFRDLFSEEYVGSDVQLSVGRQTILFTDLVGSTMLYATRGDPGAFSDVKRHFVEIYEVVAKHHGAVVKTIGDAAMAAFADPVDALEAAREIHGRFPAGRRDLGLRLRASLNSGPCIAVNLNTSIDYFGNTVNVAAKLQAFAGAGQIAFPRELLELRGVAALLEAERDELRELEYTTPGTDQRMRVLCWNVNG